MTNLYGDGVCSVTRIRRDERLRCVARIVARADGYVRGDTRHVALMQLADDLVEQWNLEHPPASVVEALRLLGEPMDA